MECLTTSNIIANIKAGNCFHAVNSEYGFTIKIDNYVPYVCAAIHDGHQFKKTLWDNCLHTEYERWYEEDPKTKAMIANQPIVVAGLDSRFEYDLNRAPELAIYEDAWGKKLWKTPLSTSNREAALKKHRAFYNVIHALIAKLEKKFGVCVVYDMHSYNWKRWDRVVPTWNLGTSNVDSIRFSTTIDEWSQILATIHLPHAISSSSKINDTFQGNGYFLKYITTHFKNTLVLATEIAKIYCDEYNYVIFPEVVASVAKQLNSLIPKHAQNFYNTYSQLK